jgi:hypothetical protein
LLEKITVAVNFYWLFIRADEVQMKFIRDMRVKIILERMTSYQDCPLLQEHGALIIGTLAVNSKPQSLYNNVR